MKDNENKRKPNYNSYDGSRISSSHSMISLTKDFDFKVASVPACKGLHRAGSGSRGQGVPYAHVVCSSSCSYLQGPEDDQGQHYRLKTD
ncbi:hypothetical protein Y1Q_0001206 [Alligator mississippiensis]|uniref:Uncharacterized protein n=1 Tax=Alligator mississippiensis TaxID=8496 RepID=A0A151PEE3_ALLMI|nr:hypothetical protein Y1Q_0001206 [Alligator mississippiensis]